MKRKKKFKGEGKEKEEKQAVRLNGKRENYFKIRARALTSVTPVTSTVHEKLLVEKFHRPLLIFAPAKDITLQLYSVP